MKINLDRPICFFDLETTGAKVGKDRIVEIAILKVDVDKSESQKVWRINPEMEISFQATNVHGITNEMVKDEPNFKHYAKEIYEFIKGCDLAGFNSIKFDVPILVEELIRAEIFCSTIFSEKFNQLANTYLTNLRKNINVKFFTE